MTGLWCGRRMDFAVAALRVRVCAAPGMTKEGVAMPPSRRKNAPRHLPMKWGGEGGSALHAPGGAVGAVHDDDVQFVQAVADAVGLAPVLGGAGGGALFQKRVDLDAEVV